MFLFMYSYKIFIYELSETVGAMEHRTCPDLDLHSIDQISNLWFVATLLTRSEDIKYHKSMQSEHIFALAQTFILFLWFSI